MPEVREPVEPAGARLAAAAAPAKKKGRTAGDGGGKPARDKGKGPKPAGGKKSKAGGGDVPKKRRAKKKKSNTTILVMMLVGALVILACVGGMAYFLLSKSGKLEQVLSPVPEDCNLVRGVNVGHIIRYALYKTEADRMMAGPLKDCWTDVAGRLSLPAGEADGPEYAVIAKKKAGGTGTVLVYRTREKFDPKALGAALGGAEQPVAGQPTYHVGGGGSLGGSVVYAASDRVIVVVLPGPFQADMVQKSVAGRGQPDNSFYGKMGKTGRKVASGHAWTLVRSDGDLRTYTADMGKLIEKDLKPLGDQMAKAPLFGTWTSFGRYITFGAAIQCDSAESAASLVNFAREGPMGKGEDQPEIPRSLKQAYSALQQKDMSEFLSNLKFYSEGDCAWVQSRMSSKEKARQALQAFANPAMAETASGGGFPGGGFPGGGPPGMGGGGPSRPGR